MLDELARVAEYKGEAICDVLEPLFIDAEAYNALQRDSALVVRGLTEAVRHAANDREMREAIGMHARHVEALRAGKTSPVLCGRMDGLLAVDGHKFIEYNPIKPDTTPSGLGDIDPINAAFAASPIMNELAARFRFRQESVFAATFDAFRHVHERMGRKGAPNVVVVEVPFRPSVQATGGGQEEEVLTSQRMRTIGYLIERGCTFSMCAVSDLQYRDGELRDRDGTRIDVTFIAGDSAYLDTCETDAPLFRAIADGAIAPADGHPVGGLVGHKALFAFLTDPACGITLGEDVADAVDRVLPWTRRMVRGTNTTHRGEDVSLDSFIRANREMLVLKPATGLGGQGVFLGWECEPRAWDEAIEGAYAEQGYIVQERVRGVTRPLTKRGNGEEVTVPHHFDLDPYVWADGQARGAYVRISQSERLNMTTGAMNTALFVVDGEITS